MRTQIRVTSAEVTLTRLLDGLERELLEASDQEIWTPPGSSAWTPP